MITRPGTIFVGALVPESTDNALRLYALMQGTSKSDLIRKIFGDFIEENNLALEALTDRYAQLMFSQWDLRFKEKYTLKEYMDLSAENLCTKEGIPKQVVDIILEKCKELKEKSQ